MNIRARAFAPVNIAWIKYMGKTNGIPTNSSLSLTLATLGTHTQLETSEQGDGIQLIWDPKGYLPPLNGQKKMESFLLHPTHWRDLLDRFGYEMVLPSGPVHITTQNNVPAGTGIATSASAYASFTLAWSAILAGQRMKEWIKLYESGSPEMRIALAGVSAQGSGSSCRSFDGPWVEWDPQRGISVIEGGSREWMDFIFLLESGPKEVPSSEAHLRVLSSPQFQGRVGRAEKRLQLLRVLLKNPDSKVSEIRKLVLNESMDMHELFHTSNPPFRYITPQSEEIISCFHGEGSGLPTQNGVLTLDAGANIHLFIPVEEESLWSAWVGKKFPQVRVLKDLTGYGGTYET